MTAERPAGRRPRGHKEDRVTRDDVQRWLDGYVDAWRSNDPEAIGALFAPDATYRFQPYGDPVVGREAIVANWLEDPDEPGSWQARYEPYAVDGDRAVAIGESRYVQPDGSLRDLFLPLDAAFRRSGPLRRFRGVLHGAPGAAQGRPLTRP